MGQHGSASGSILLGLDGFEVRERYHEPTKRYMARRTAEGKSEREVRRSLKRVVARQLYRLLERGTTSSAAPRLPAFRPSPIGRTA